MQDFEPYQVFGPTSLAMAEEYVQAMCEPREYRIRQGFAGGYEVWRVWPVGYFAMQDIVA